MTQYELLTIKYYNEYDEILTRTYKRATFMFDNSYTSITSKEEDFTVRTDNVISITGSGKYEAKQ